MMEIVELIIFSIYFVLESVVLTFFTVAFVGLIIQKKKEKKMKRTDYGIFSLTGGMILYTVGMLSLKSNELLGIILVIIGSTIITIGLCLTYQRMEDNGKNKVVDEGEDSLLIDSSEPGDR